MSEISLRARQPGFWWSCAAFAVGFGPLVLLVVLAPETVQRQLSFALAAICAVLATFLLRTQSNPWPGKVFGAPSAAKPQLEPANENSPSSSGLPGREMMLSILSQDLTPSLPPTLLGIVRIANYDRMAAADVTVADRFLSAFYTRLHGALGKSRHLALIERNCFAIWFAGASTTAAAQAELRALGYALTQQICQDTLSIEPELEIGFAESVQSEEGPSELITRALASLIKPVIRGSKLEPVKFDPVPDLRRRFALEQDLNQAINKGEFALHYQPFIDTARGRVSGAEALLRWNHPQYGMISPNEFVPILEQTGLMHDVGIWVLNTACRQLREWRAAGSTDFTMAINLSAQQLQNAGLKTIIERTVQNHGLPASSIELELTETAAMEDSLLTLKLFRSLREAGFGLSIDDFGSGYSSLSYLKNLPFSKLKIDREFVSYVDERSASRAICKALIELTSGLNISVLAEGVERRAEVDALNQMGCSQFQGFYFAKPMSPLAFATERSESLWLGSFSPQLAEVPGELKRQRP